jgi:hypothetical protein
VRCERRHGSAWLQLQPRGRGGQRNARKPEE